MDLSTLFEWYLNHLNYGVLTILMILENSVVPLPAELIVAPAAYRAAHGEMSLVILILCTTVASTIGALINYYLSRHVGRFIIYKMLDSKVARILMLDKDKLQRAEQLFLKHGNASTFFGRLLPFGRQLISVPAGLAKMPVGRFVFYTFVGSALWNSFLSGIGYYLAQVLPKEELIDALNKYSLEMSVAFVAVIVVYVIFQRKKN